jgi:nucleoside-diphosphate-sugar epimerase
MTDSPIMLVTGAEGFLGSNIVSQLRQEQVAVISGVHTQQTAMDKQVLLDICDRDAVNRTFAEYRPDYVIHCAAYGVNYQDRDIDMAINVNVHGSLNLLEAASLYPVKRFVHIGSCFEYGSFAGPVAENALPRPTDIYGSSKLAATVLMLERSTNLNVPLLVLRPFGMWGPSEKSHRLVPQIINAHLTGASLDLTPCLVTRDYLYVADAAGVIVKLCLLPTLDCGRVVNVGSGKPIVLKEFVLSLARILGCEGTLNFGALKPRATEIASLVADTSLLSSIIGEFEKTGLEDGLQQMLNEAATFQ